MRGLIIAFLLFCAVFSADLPCHVYLSLTGDTTQFKLTFTSHSFPSSGYVAYWIKNETEAKGTTIDLSSEDTVQFVTPFNVTEYITSVTLYNLLPATDYLYSIVPYGNTPSMNVTYGFTTLPLVGEPLNILMYGDLGSEGTAITSGALYEWANSKKMHFVIHYGDLAYNLATNNGSVGEQFMANIQNISASYPYVVLPGNHEYMDESNDEKYYWGWFQGQSLLGSSPSPLSFHSYDIGEDVHFIGINTEVYCEDPDYLVNQWYWLKKDLETVRSRPTQPWVVVYGHRQMYEGTNSHFHTLVMRLGIQCTDDSLQTCNMSQACLSGVNCGYSLESLFQEYKIDIFIAGHMHSYLRMYPIANNSMFENQNNATYFNPSNPVYIISGAAGDQNTKSEIKRGEEEVTATPNVVANGNFSLSLLSIFNSSAIRFQQVLLDNEIFDELWIIKDSNKPKWETVVPFTISNVTDSPLCNQ